jgi:hypothetical protein
MDEMTNALLIYFEMVAVNLCSKFALPVSGLQIYVGELPDTFQQAQHIRFGYSARIGRFHSDKGYDPQSAHKKNPPA